MNYVVTSILFTLGIFVIVGVLSYPIGYLICRRNQRMKDFVYSFLPLFIFLIGSMISFFAILHLH